MVVKSLAPRKTCSFIIYTFYIFLDCILLCIRYPPIALQPSLGQFFSHVNEEWRSGYRMIGSSRPKLSNVIVVSVSGGIHDYQVFSCAIIF
jgi:hypothetical protein